MDGQSFDEELPLVARARYYLEDHTRPIPCILMFIGPLVDLGKQISAAIANKKHYPKQMEALTRQQNLILTSAMRWVSAPRRLDELVPRSKSPSCACAKQETCSRDHQHALFQFKESSHASLQTYLCQKLCELVKAAIDAYPVHDLQRNKTTKRTRWPCNLAELMPRGPENTIRGITRWLSTDLTDVLHRYILMITNDIYLYGGSAVLPYIVTSRSLITLGLIQPLQKECKFLETCLARPTEVRPRAEGIGMIVTCMGMADAMVLARCDTVQRHYMVCDQAGKLIMLCDRLFHGLQELQTLYPWLRDDKQTQETVESVFLFGLCLYEEFPHLDVSLISPECLELWSDEERGLAGEVRRTLDHIRASKRCASPECLKNFWTTWPFQTCGGCRRVMYCSRRCQKISWNHPTLGHRSVCTLIRQMCSKYDLNFDGQREPPQLSAPYIKIGQRIVGHFEAQTRYEIETFCKAAYSFFMLPC
jgi:hypothetical protein